MRQRRAAVVAATLVMLVHPLARTASAQSACLVQTPVGAADNQAFAVALQSDGKIVAAGTSFNGVNIDFTVIRYNADLTLDTSFGGGAGFVVTPLGPGDDVAQGVAIQPDGNIVVSGYSDNGVDDDFAVVRYLPNGILDPGFAGGGILVQPIGPGNDDARAVAIQSDGNIVVAGRAEFGGVGDFAAIRLDTLGVLDATFDGDGIVTTPIGPSWETARDIAFQSDGKIVLGGYGSNGADLDFALVRYNTDGSLDTTFDTDGKVMTTFSGQEERGRDIALQSDGKILLVGSHVNGLDDDWLIARYNANGSIDTSFDGDGFVVVDFAGANDFAREVLVQPDGRILVSGDSHNGGDSDLSVVRLHPDGTFDTSFGTNGIATGVFNANQEGEAGALQSDGRIVVVGYTDGANRDNALVRFEADGTLACDQVALHPTGPGSLNTFSSFFGCIASWDCVNDQPSNAGVGSVVTNDGVTSFIRDNDAQTNRVMFSLDNGTVPVGAIITEITLRAQVGHSGGPLPTLHLSYERIGFDPGPVDSSGFGFTGACCGFAISQTIAPLAWSTAELDALEIGLFHSAGGQIDVSQLYVEVTYLDPPRRTNYRSIGTRPDYGTGGPEGVGTTINLVTNDNVVVGVGTTWVGSNRGRGDVINIGGTDHTVLSVDSDTQLTLTERFLGPSAAGQTYVISRQFPNLHDWDDCIDGPGGLPCAFFPVASSSLVGDNRNEVGVAYADSVFTPPSSLRLENMTTDPDHTITLTAGLRNRHNGMSGAGVVIDGQNNPNGIDVRSDYTTIEWLELVKVRGTSLRGAVEVAGPGPVTGALLQNLLINDFHDPGGNNIAGILIRGGAGKDTVIRNVMIWDGDRYGIFGGAAGDTLVVDNVSIDDMLDVGAVGIDSNATAALFRNTIAMGSAVGDFVGPFDPSSDFNISSDGSAPGASSMAFILASDIFVAPGFDLHLKPLPNPAVDTGIDLSSDFTRDVDGDSRVGGWDRGADELFVPGLRINYRSIGLNAADMKTGAPTVTISSGTAFVSLPQVGVIDVGDEINYGSSAIAFITSRVSATEFTVADALGDPAPDTAGAPVNSITRAYNALQAWEDDREGDLVSENRREVGVMYNDGTFTNGLLIDDSTTDAQRFMMLTVARLNRHFGVEGSGTVLDGFGTDSSEIEISDDYTVLEWLEIRDTQLPASGAILVRNAHGVLLSHLLVHDSQEGIHLSGGGGNGFTVRNSIIYNNADDGIGGDEATDTIVVDNCTLFANGDSGVDHSVDTVFHVTNTISVLHPGQDFEMTAGTQSNNITSDGTGFGVGTLINRSVTDIANPGAGDWVIFTNLGLNDYHLLASAENDAVDAGVDLSPLFWDDIDGTSRTDTWDIGADELGSLASGITLSSESNQTFVVGQSPTPAASVAIFESAVGGNVTAGDDLRLRIPSGFQMRWDTSVTTVVLAGSAALKVEATVLAYEDDAKTVVLDVNTDFLASEDVTISGLGLWSFTAPSPLDNLELEVRNDDTVAALDEKSILITAAGTATISSYDDQVFTDAAPPALSETITVSEATDPSIVPGNDIHILIPSGLNMLWDSSVFNPDFGGPAASKVDPSVIYTNGDTELIITVTVPFVTGDYLEISDVGFLSFVGPSMGYLELEIGLAAADVDDKLISIVTTGSVEVLTATSTTTQNHLEWVNPNDPAYVHTRILARDDGVFPTDPLDLVNARLVSDHVGAMGSRESLDDMGLMDDTTYHYAAFVFNGTDYSDGVETAGRPFDNGTGDIRWAYSTGATAMAPPALRFQSPTNTFVYAVSNDSLVHAMNGSGGATPGEWPTNWRPARLGGIAQQRPPVIPIAVGGASTTLFTAAQNGSVYAIDADTGNIEWESPGVASMLTASPAGIFMTYTAPFDFLLVGTRNGTPPNFFHALNPFTGAIDWTFDNSGGQGGDNLPMGIVSSGAVVQYQDPGDGSPYFFFASRTASSPHTVWCVKWDGSVVNLVWTSDLPGITGSPDIDGSPVRSTQYGGRLYVGTNDGEVVALNAVTGAVEWIFPTNDGPVKGFVFPKHPSTNLYLSTNNKVWSLSDDDTSVSQNTNWPTTLVPNPSTPLPHPFAPHILVGSSNGKLYQLDKTDPNIFEEEELGDGDGGLGMPTIDIFNDMIYVGTEQGIIYAVDYPLLP